MIGIRQRFKYDVRRRGLCPARAHDCDHEHMVSRLRYRFVRSAQLVVLCRGLGARTGSYRQSPQRRSQARRWAVACPVRNPLRDTRPTGTGDELRDRDLCLRRIPQRLPDLMRGDRQCCGIPRSRGHASRHRDLQRWRAAADPSVRNLGDERAIASQVEDHATTRMPMRRSTALSSATSGSIPRMRYS
jgi:hypothetical protein